MTTQPALLLSGVFAILSAGIYGYVGRRLARRLVSSSEARLAWGLFIVWWYGLAVSTFTSGALNLLAAFGLRDLPLFFTGTSVNILMVCAALWGLLYYLIYLFTGNSRTLWPLTIFYIVYYVLLVYYIAASDPVSVNVGRWSATMVYRFPIAGPFYALLLILLVVPQIIGSLAYFSLFFRVQDLTQKYRIMLVSWSIIIWFGSALAVSLGGLAEQDWWQILSRLIGLAAALAILAAYVPPHWLMQRYGIKPIDESGGGSRARSNFAIELDLPSRSL